MELSVLLFELLEFLEFAFDVCFLRVTFQHLIVDLFQHVYVLRCVERANDFLTTSVLQAVQQKNDILDAPFLNPLDELWFGLLLRGQVLQLITHGNESRF